MNFCPRSSTPFPILSSLLLMTLALWWPGISLAAAGPTVVSTNPSGDDVQAARQIVLQFDRPMVPIGRMERTADELGIAVEPALECQWRWLDTSALACQLNDADTMQPATRYALTLEPGLTAVDGSRLEQRFEHSFLTQRPRVRRPRFETWRAPGWPVMQVTFDQAVELDSARQHLYLRVDGERRAVDLGLRDGAPASSSTAALQSRHFTLQPLDELPLDARVDLVIEPGVRSAVGSEPGVEQRTLLTFWTFPEHRFVGISCRTNDEVLLLLTPEEAAADIGRCNPLGRVSLEMSSPVIKDVVSEHLEVEPDLAGGRDDYDPWANLYSYSRLDWTRAENQRYSITLPENLRADTEYRLRASAENFTDEFGRPLAADIDFTFKTDDRPPRRVLTHPVSVLEHGVDTHVPLVVTNLDSVTVEGKLLRSGGAEDFVRQLRPPAAANVAYRYPLKARDWLNGDSGAVLAKLTSQPAGSGKERWLFTQVTPFAVHVKLGHRNTLVWVTSMATGEPVAGAEVQIYRASMASFGDAKPALSQATTDEYGIAMLDGNDQLDPEIDFTGGLGLPHRPETDSILQVRVDHPTGIALLPLSWEMRVRPGGSNSYRVWPQSQPRYGHVKAWGTTAQGVYRIGDTVRYKLYVRDTSNRRLVAARQGPYTLKVEDPTGKVVHEVENFQLDAFGAVDGQFTIGRSAAVGWYRFDLSSDFLEYSREPMRVLVADFTPAPFRVSTDLDGDLYRDGDSMTVTTAARLHAGGPYADAGSRVTVSARRTWLNPSSPLAQGFYFDTGNASSQTLHQSEAEVDGSGDLVTTLTLPATKILFGRLSVESAVRDDRGKYIASRASARFVGRDRYVGVRSEGWLLETGEEATVDSLVIDERGEPIGGTPVDTEIFYQRTKASRVKGAGNAYLTKYSHSWELVASCSSEPAPEATPEPQLCPFTPAEPGRYRAVSTIRDSRGREHASELSRWAIGTGRTLFETPPGHHLPIDPEQADYEVGDVARFLVRNPFPGAQALITVERVGIMERRLQVLESATEVIEVDVTPDHLPGFYLSVTVTSPRVAMPREEGQVDLGKPAFRIGTVRVPVWDRSKEIQVEITPDREVYRPRDEVMLELQATLPAGVQMSKEETAAEGAPERPPVQLAVAVLDEAVFDLIETGSANFDPYRGFYALDAVDVANFNLLKRLIGIQDFAKKGANPGGGGSGGPDLRSLFEFVSYWNPALATDDQGRAEVSFKVPDNLTGWRVLALAVTPDDLMGLGEGTFAVNQPIEIRPALPNQVTEGDRFDARFTILNRTGETMKVRVDATVSGPAESPGLSDHLIVAEPFKRQTVSFPVRTIEDGDLSIHIEAMADLEDNREQEEGRMTDGLRLPLKVHKRVALLTAANYGSTTGEEVIEALEIPAAIRDDVGSITVAISPSVIGALDSAFRYMRDYPYTCWEQKLSRAVTASHFVQLRDYLNPETRWPGAEAVPNAMLAQLADHQAPNGGMVYWLPEDRYVSPYLSAYTALALVWLREHGYDVPDSAERKLQDYLRKLLRSDTFPTFYQQGMESSVRAVALAALAERGALDLEDVRRYRQHVKRMDLFGKAHMLAALSAVGADEEEIGEVRAAILAHSNRTAGKLGFVEQVDAEFRRILYSPMRSHCAITSALVRSHGREVGAGDVGGIGDLPFRLVRTLTQDRRREDRWENTQENVFCMNALVDYSKAYETEKPRFAARAFLSSLEGGPGDEEKLGSVRLRDVRAPTGELVRPLRAADVGDRKQLRITRSGKGRMYYMTRLQYSPLELPTSGINSGIEVRREISVERDGEWQAFDQAIEVAQGELVRVDLFVSVPAPRRFVVVDDPVPGGFEPVNRDLATASDVDADKAQARWSAGSFWWHHDDWQPYGYSRWSFYHRELRHDSARFYSEYLSAGNYHLSYVAQAIAPGTFQVGPLRAEDMYDPDIYGQGVPATLEVEP